jgi:hypothetical protein
MLWYQDHAPKFLLKSLALYDRMNIVTQECPALLTLQCV